MIMTAFKACFYSVMQGKGGQTPAKFLRTGSLLKAFVLAVLGEVISACVDCETGVCRQNSIVLSLSHTHTYTSVTMSTASKEGKPPMDAAGYKNKYKHV